ncbi:MAG TPA: ATP-grasp domain-containing protein [Dehalococcoidia bacterium]
MPRVLLVLPSTTYRASDFLAAARRLGVEVVVASDQRQVLESLVPGRSLAVDLNDAEAAAGAMAAFARAHPVDAVVAVDDGGTLAAALAAERLGLPHNPVEAVRATRDKGLLRERLAEAGVPCPDFRLLPLDGDPARAAPWLPYPCVVKPLSLSGSRGVIRADDPASFLAAFQRVQALLSRPEVAAQCGGSAREVLVEGYIPGREVSLEGLLAAGRLHALALFDKPDPLEGPFFEETIYVTPSRLPPPVQAQVLETAERSARALGLRDGPVHVELRINEAGVWPVDVAARSIGGLCSRTLTFGTGMSLEELILRHAVGAPIPTYQREARAAGVMMIPIPGRGTLRAVHGLRAAEAVPGIQSVTITIPRGRPVVPLPEGDAYLGFIFARGERPEEVETALRAAHACLRFDIEPAEVTAGAAPGGGCAG